MVGPRLEMLTERLRAVATSLVLLGRDRARTNQFGAALEAGHDRLRRPLILAAGRYLGPDDAAISEPGDDCGRAAPDATATPRVREHLGRAQRSIAEPPAGHRAAANRDNLRSWRKWRSPSFAEDGAHW